MVEERGGRKKVFSFSHILPLLFLSYGVFPFLCPGREVLEFDVIVFLFKGWVGARVFMSRVFLDCLVSWCCTSS